MVYIYLPVGYYHLHLDVTKENLLAAGFSTVPAVFLVCITNLCYPSFWKNSWTYLNIPQSIV